MQRADRNVDSRFVSSDTEIDRYMRTRHIVDVTDCTGTHLTDEIIDECDPAYELSDAPFYECTSCRSREREIVR